MRLILVSTTLCRNHCPGCYYRYRREEGPEIPGLLAHLLRAQAPADVAIGLNSGYYRKDLELASMAIDLGCDVILTLPMDDQIVGDIPQDTLDSVGTISLSMNGGGDSLTTRSIRKLARAHPPKILSIIAGANGYLSAVGDPIVEDIGIEMIYALIRKGPPDIGWSMNHETISQYWKDVSIIYEATDTPVKIDECVLGILSSGYGNCMGTWREVDSHGGVRNCPYTASPDCTIYGSAELELHPLPAHIGCTPTNKEQRNGHK